MGLKESLDASPTAKELAAEKRRNKRLESELEELERQLKDLRQKRLAIPTDTGRRRGRSEASFLRLIIPDTHGAMMDKPAIAAFLADVDQLKPREVIWLGDHMDCGSYLDEKHTIGYVSQTNYTVADDEDAANQLLDAVQKRTPGAEHHYLEGNHEWRMERDIVARAKGREREITRYLSRNGTEAVLSLGTRNIPYYRRGECYMGLRNPGVIQLGKCYFTHGARASRNATASYAERYGGNIVFGHTHRAAMSIVRNVHQGTYGAWNPGCLCELQPLWMHTDPTNWSHGYALQVVSKSGEFLTVLVPIIDGVSYLKPLASQLGK